MLDNGKASDRHRLLRYHRGVMPIQCTFSAFVILLSVAVVATGSRGEEMESSYPARPVKVIVPFAAGGGSDMFGRIVQQAIDEESLLPERLVIINVPGAGGTIGSRRVKNARPDGYTLLLLHEGILTAKFAGQAAYGPEAFEPIAGTGAVDQVIAVADGSPHADLPGLMSMAAEEPEQIVVAANLGAPSHFAGLMLEHEQPGARFRYMQAGGGAKRFAALQGGHVDVSAFSIAEYVQFQSAGLRALAVFSPNRHRELPEVPTATEQGFDVISENMQFWWAPRGTPPARVSRIATALEQVMQLPRVREQLATMNMEPTFLVGDALDDELEKRERRLSSVVNRPVPSLPHLPVITLLLTAALGLWAWRSTRRAGGPVPGRRRIGSSHRWLSAAVVAVTCLYVALLQQGWLGFRPATIGFIVVVGSLLARRWSVLPLLGPLAIGLSFGIHYLFTSVLVVDLP